MGWGDSPRRPARSALSGDSVSRRVCNTRRIRTTPVGRADGGRDGTGAAVGDRQRAGGGTYVLWTGREPTARRLGPSLPNGGIGVREDARLPDRRLARTRDAREAASRLYPSVSAGPR